jgi:hypothetical protein
MPEPEDHTLRLLRNIRTVTQSTDKKVDKLDTKIEEVRDELKASIDEIREFAFGGSILGQFATARVEKRRGTIEKRLSALEKRRP